MLSLQEWKGERAMDDESGDEGENELVWVRWNESVTWADDQHFGQVF